MRNRMLILILALSLAFAMSSCGLIGGEPEHKHQPGNEWVNDGVYHWHVCSGEGCDYVADKAEHTGGTATETEKAKCEVCGAEYGELKAHEHAFGEWATKTPADCEKAEVEERACACGVTETREGDAALGHHYTEEVATEDYFVSANCEEKATYYKSCACGLAGTETFVVGDVIGHAFGDWTTKTPADCENAEVETRSCANCHKEETREGDAALDHNMVNAADYTHHWTECDREGCDKATEKVAHTALSISAVYNKDSAMEHDALTAADFNVTGLCECEKNYPVTEGITLENSTLTFGENTVTVKLGDLSTTVTLNAVKFNKVINGTISDDTYISSSAKEEDYSKRESFGTKSGSFRTYFRINLSSLLNDSAFAAYKGSAKVQFSFVITDGSTADDSTFTLKAYSNAGGIPFSEITWKSVDNKEGNTPGKYSNLYWDNGTILVYDGLGHNVSVKDGVITITLAYSQIEEFIDSDSNILLAFATNTSGLKIGSMDHGTKKPSFKVVLNDEHFCVFDKEVATEQYLVSANCEEQNKYFYSCSCGEAGTKTFAYGEMNEHSYTKADVKEEALAKDATCASGALYYYSCAACNKVNNADGAETFVNGEPTTVHVPGEDDNDCSTKVVCTVCGETTTEAISHDYTGEWLKDENNHWHECQNEGCNATETAAAHASNSPATETEDEVCASCGWIMAAATGHEHNYNIEIVSDETKASDATCKVQATYYYSCRCNDVSDTLTFSYGELAAHAPGEDDGDCTTAVTCTVCGADTTPANEEHAWGDWAITTPATIEAEGVKERTCTSEGCNGKETGVVAKLQEYVVDISMTQTEKNGNKYYDDTYITGSSSSKDSNYLEKAWISTKDSKDNSYRPVIRIDLSDILEAAKNPNFDPNTAKIQLTFKANDSATKTALLETTNTYSFYLFAPGAGVSDADFSKYTWNNRYGLERGSATYLFEDKTKAEVSEHISVSGTQSSKVTITFTFTYAEIMEFISTDADTYGYLVFGFDSSATTKFDSMEATTASSRPSIKVTYYV